jgi:cytochrome c oxidase assembly protein subunit 11
VTAETDNTGAAPINGPPGALVPPQGRAAASRTRIGRWSLWLAALAVAMFAFGYALVPVYEVFCRLTGLNGRPAQTAALAPGQGRTRVKIDRTRQVSVEFTTDTANDLPWDFQPVVERIRIHPGEPVTVRFRIRNRAAEPMVGRAVPSIAPNPMAHYLVKTECFCFQEQPLKAGEEKVIPVTFYLDPALPETVGVMTLAYTFFRSTAPVASR